MNNVVSLDVARQLRKTEDPDYHAKILGMDKANLLEEMVRFQEERSRVGHLTLQMMIQGKILFKALEQGAESPELHALTRSYRRHLEHEMDAYMRKLRANS